MSAEGAKRPNRRAMSVSLERTLTLIGKSSREARPGAVGPATASSPTVLAPANARAVTHAIWLSLTARVG